MKVGDSYMNREIKEIIIAKLQELSVYHCNSDGTEHTVRCPYCGDSKTPSHAHLGIFIDPNDDNGMVWHCFRCGVGGILTDEVLEDLGVFMDETSTRNLRAYNKKVQKLSNKRTILRTERFVVPLSNATPLTNTKLQYVNQRLGTEFDYVDAQQNKFILSFLEFMTVNEIPAIPSVKDWVYRVLEQEYVGFLSSNNNCITFRNINPNSHGKRYMKIILNPLNPDDATFYSVPTRLDLLYENDLHVHIAEGTFDILSIKYNLRPNVTLPGEHIFYASCGYSYTSILKHLIRNGIATNLNVHIYADADKSDDDHLGILRRSAVRPFITHAFLHRNGYPGMKDYGVRYENIHHLTRQLW